MLTCKQCGLEDLSNQIQKRVERGKDRLCSSCTAKPAKVVKSRFGRCRPWPGPFDANDNPIDEETGHLIRPGKRLCGNRDCMAVDHIEIQAISTAELLERIRHEEGEQAYFQLLAALQEARNWRHR